MHPLFAVILCVGFSLVSIPALAQEKTAEVTFQTIEELGARSKPNQKIRSAAEALDFIVADKLVRAAMIDKMAEGYQDWKAIATLMGYDGSEPVYEVRVTSSTLLPPYACVFRFDSVGNDRREQPWAGCQYE